MDYKFRISSTVADTGRHAYAHGEMVTFGGVDWTVSTDPEVALAGISPNGASVTLEGRRDSDPRRVVHVGIDGYDVGAYGATPEVEESSMARFLDAVFGDMEQDWIRRSRDVRTRGRGGARSRDAAALANLAEAGVRTPSGERCAVSDLFATGRLRRFHVGDGEFELDRDRISFARGHDRVLIGPARYGKHAGPRPEGAWLWVTIRMDNPPGNGYRGPALEAEILVTDRPDGGYDIVGDQLVVTIVAPLIDHAGWRQARYLPGFRVREAERQQLADAARAAEEARAAEHQVRFAEVRAAQRAEKDAEEQAAARLAELRPALVARL